jgi:TRAP-type C4-dicarboxylate transport system substrate-binding protein
MKEKQMKKMRLLVFILVGVLLVVAPLLGACSGEAEEPEPTEPTEPTEPEEPEETEVIELTYGSILPSTEFGSISDLAWIERIEEETNGRVHITPYWGGTLINPRASVTDLRERVADIAFIVPSFEPGTQFYIHDALEIMLYASPTPEIAVQVYKELSGKFPEISAEFAGLKVLGMATPLCEQLLTVKPVRSLEDLRGLSIKSTPTWAPVYETLEAELVAIPASEVYINLQKGLLDGCQLPLTNFYTANLAEVVKYTTDLEIVRLAGAVVKAMNMDAWNSLPPDIQQVFDDNVDWWTQKSLEDTEIINQAGFDRAEEMGVEFIKLPPEDLSELYEIIDTVSAEKAAELDAMGLPGTEILEEIHRLIEQYSE